MVERIKANVARIGFYGWIRFVSGLVLLAAMLYYDIHLDKTVEVLLYAFPAYLLGMDLTKLVKPK